MRTSRVTSCLVALVLLAATAPAQTSKALTIYVIDVEGGNAQLYVSPSGESLLIDTGNAGTAATRDAERILEAVKDAGLSRIDHLITTHFHADHVGGVAEVAARIPIAEFIDHGPNVQPGGAVDGVMQQYAALSAKAKHTVAKPGRTRRASAARAPARRPGLLAEDLRAHRWQLHRDEQSQRLHPHLRGGAKLVPDEHRASQSATPTDCQPG